MNRFERHIALHAAVVRKVAGYDHASSVAMMQANVIKTAPQVSPGIAPPRLGAIPFVGNVELFAYRSDLFKKYGVGQPKSWTEVVKAARAVAEGEKGMSGVVFRGKKANPIVTGFLPILWAHGARSGDRFGRLPAVGPYR